MDLDLITAKGTALHLACRLGKFSFVSSLLASGAQANVKNSDGYLPLDLATNPDIIDLFLKKSIKKSKIDQSKSQINFENIADEKMIYEKPPIVKGEFYKIGKSGLILNKRYFVLNAEEGTLIRFQVKADFPLKPKYL